MVQQLNQQQVLNLQAQRNQAARQPSDAAPQALPMAPLRSQQSIQNLTPDRIAKLTLTQQQQQKKAQQHLSTLIPTIPPFERSENSETFVAIVGMHPMYMDRDGAMSCSWAH
jgi:hypothetical protein